MTVAVVCPHCETHYQLQPDLVGKAMRCPNRDCAEIFTVTAVAEAAPPMPVVEEHFPTKWDLDPPPIPIPDSLPYQLEIEPPAKPVEDQPPLAKPLPAATLLPPAPAPKQAKLLPPAPKVVEWSDAAQEDKTLRGKPVSVAEFEELESLEAAIEARKRKQRRALPKQILFGLIAATIITLTGIGVYVFRFNTMTEDKLAEEAKSEYAKGNFGTAQTKYDELLTRFPESTEQERYKFFVALAKIRGTVAAVTFADNPTPGIKAYREFITEYGKTPYAKTDGTGFAVDIYETGKQAVDGLVAFANMNLKNFRDEGRSKSESLDIAEKAVAEAREMVTLAETFRDKDSAPAETQRTSIGKITGDIGEERHRLTVLAPFRGLPEDPTDDRIVEFETVLKNEKLADDAEARTIVETAKRKLRELVRPERNVVAAVLAPPDAAPSVAVSLAVEAPPVVPGSERKTDGPPETVFALARGLLTALDADSGNVLWVQRVAAGTADPKKLDLPARVPLNDGSGEVALVVSDVGGEQGLTARDVRTGEALWYQPLEAAAAGRAVVVKGRAYLPLRDSLGTVVEFDLADGTRLGHVRLRQPIGPAVALRPGTGLLYVPADARRVFVIDVDARSADGDRQPARCVQVIPTEHLPDSLRGAPVVVGPPGLGPVPRYLVVMQSEGPQGMKLRAFPLVDPPKVVDPMAPVADLPPVAPVAEISVAGWATFAPTTDGERLALVSDNGAVAIFGVNQPLNGDTAVFGFPVTASPTAKADGPIAGQVVLAEEDSLWVIAGGDLIRLRTAVDPMQGIRLIPAGIARPVGEPLHRSQLTTRRDVVVTTVRHPKSGACRAVAIDPRDGRVIWQRQLAPLPPTPPIQTAKGILLVDEDGGVALIAPDLGNGETKNRIIPVTVAVAPPVGMSAGPAVAAVSRDGNTAWVLVPEVGTKGGNPLRIRQIVDGKLTTNVGVPLPANLAGMPVALSTSVLIPLADGVVYRFVPGEEKLQIGPTWKSETAPADALAYLCAGTNDAFFGSDGNDRFTKWIWASASDAKWVKAAGPWECIGRIQRPIATVTLAAGEMVLVADAGGLAMYAGTAPAEPVRKWRGAKAGPIPLGEPTQGPIVANVGKETWRVAIVLGGKAIVLIDPNVDGAVGVSPAEGEWDSIGVSTDAINMVSTDAAGRVRIMKLLDGKTGESVSPGLPGALPAPNGQAIPFGPNRLLMPLMDGSAVLVFVP